MNFCKDMKNILICDDDPMTIRALEFQFKKEGFNVLKAADGKAAINILDANEDIEIMVTDLYMPFITGLELITYVRKSLHRIFPIVVVSRVNVDDSIEQAMSIGANAYLTKPLNLIELSETVKNLLDV